MIIGRYKIEREDKYNVKLSKLQTVNGKKGEREEYVFIGYFGNVSSAFNKIIKDEELDLLESVSLQDFLKKYEIITQKYIKELSAIIRHIKS